MDLPHGVSPGVCCMRYLLRWAGSRDSRRWVSAALGPQHHVCVTGVSLAAGALDMAGVALCQRWCVTQGLWDLLWGQGGLFVVQASCAIPLHS